MEHRIFHPATRIWPILISLLLESKLFPCIHLQETGSFYLVYEWLGRA
jgi:hypothetical protein